MLAKTMTVEKMKTVVHALLLSCLIACGENMSVSVPSETAAPSDPNTNVPNDTLAIESIDLTFCESTLTSDPAGYYCAIKPSALDSRTKDIAGKATAEDRVLGFGYHVVAIPKKLKLNNKLWIHFGGSMGRPYDPNKKSFISTTWISELLEKGYVVVQLAYDNRKSVAEDCNTAQGLQTDDCSGLVTDEVVTGVNTTVYRDTDDANGVDFRLKTLLAFLKTKAQIPLPSSLNAESLDWSNIKVSGHSQGGNLAYYMAKERGVSFACMLGAPYDVDDNINPTLNTSPDGFRIADWFRSGSSATPPSQMGQLVTTEDLFYGKFRDGALYVGLTPGVEAFESSKSYADGTEAHGASVGDPELKSLRASACLRGE